MSRPILGTSLLQQTPHQLQFPMVAQRLRNDSYGQGGPSVGSIHSFGPRGDRNGGGGVGSRGGGGGGGWNNRTGGWDRGREREANPFQEDADTEPAFGEQENTGINFNAYEDIPVETSGKDVPPPINTFADIDELNLNIRRCKYVKPTPVQRYAIPIALGGRDLMACAQTGSGKTVAFCCPIISGIMKTLKSSQSSSRQSRMLRMAFPFALLLSPTRELSMQIHEEARKFAYQTGVKVVVAYGGVPINLQPFPKNGFSIGFLSHVSANNNRSSKVANGSISFQIESRVCDASHPLPSIPLQLMDEQREDHLHHHHAQSNSNENKDCKKEEEKVEEFRILGHPMTLKRKCESDLSSSMLTTTTTTLPSSSLMEFKVPCDEMESCRNAVRAWGNQSLRNSDPNIFEIMEEKEG